MTVDPSEIVRVHHAAALYKQIRTQIVDAKSIAGTFTNAGSGWNTQAFREAFGDTPSIVAIPNATGYTVEIKDVTASQFLYRLLASGSTTADAVEVMWIATLRNELMMAINEIVDTGYDTVAEVLADETAFFSLAESEEAIGILYDDATARKTILGSANLMNIVFNSDAAMTALENHALMSSQAAESDMFQTKIVLYEMGLPVETADSSAEFAASSTVLDLVLSSSSARSAALSNSTTAAALANNNTFFSTMVSDSTIMSDVAAEPEAMSVLTSNSNMMGALATSAIALNAICKVSDARTKWMNSSYAHTYYSDVYNTLHNAPTTLFTKYEGSYSSAHSEYYGTTIYSNNTGGFTKTGSTTASHANAVPFAGVTLVNKWAANYVGLSCYYGSSQTKENLATLTSSSMVSANKVMMGGLSSYRVASSSVDGYPNVMYATYVAV